MNKKIKGGYFEYDSIILHLIVFFKSSVVNLNDLFFSGKIQKMGDLILSHVIYFYNDLMFQIDKWQFIKQKPFCFIFITKKNQLHHLCV
jgi:hypothetical protein